MSIPGILVKIVDTKKKEVSELQSRSTIIKEASERNTRKPLDFKKALSDKPGLAVISEIKKASPSAGVICSDFHPVNMAKAYANGGAAAISVLTDIDYFQGHPDYLKEIRQHVDIPLLRKDFIIDELQIHEAVLLGADTFLLIVAILEKEQLKDLLQIGRSMGMNPLVEIHDEKELETALYAGADIIGVNNRDLNNFTVDIGLTTRLSPMVPDNCLLVGESGIKTVQDAAQLKKAGCKAILVGETLMRQGLEGCGYMIDKLGNS